jgi:hypothetical protein
MKQLQAWAFLVAVVVLAVVWVYAPSIATPSDERREYLDLEGQAQLLDARIASAEAQRQAIVARVAQATRQAIATRQAVNAIATADARALSKAERETQATATAAYMQAQQTMDASNAQATANAMQSNATATAITLYQQAVIAQQTSVAAQRQTEIDAALVETTKRNNELRAVMINYAVSGAAVALVVLLAWGAALCIATYNHRKRIIESRAGTLALTNPRGQFTPFVLNAGEIVDWSATSEAGEAQTVEDARALVPLSDEDRMRAEALRLLRHSIDAIGDGVKLATWRDLAANGWTARQWTHTIKVLATCGLVESTSKGTFIKGHTARKLYDAIGSKAVSLRGEQRRTISPTASAEAV